MQARSLASKNLYEECADKISYEEFFIGILFFYFLTLLLQYYIMHDVCEKAQHDSHQYMNLCFSKSNQY